MLDAERDERAARSSRTTSIGASGRAQLLMRQVQAKRCKDVERAKSTKNLVEVAALSQHSWVGGNAAR